MTRNELSETLYIVDLEPFLNDPSSPEAVTQCNMIAMALQEHGAVIIKDPRVTENHNDSFLDLMERYFEQNEDEKLCDARPLLNYQVGSTPAFKEVPRCTSDPNCHSYIASLAPSERPHVISQPDPKWRFFWRIGERPPTTSFKELNAEPVLPRSFPEWSNVMNTWGSLLKTACITVADMAAVGMGLDDKIFSKMCQYGAHLLAPTGTDLNIHGKIGTVFAGFHYDISFLTIHGRSRFPGLYVWTRDGRKLPVRVPDGCLLVQAGIQIEWLTGGSVKAGYHEVVADESTLLAVDRARLAQRSCWRISSTLFLHIETDLILQPLGSFATPESLEKYPAKTAGEIVASELLFIALAPE